MKSKRTYTIKQIMSLIALLVLVWAFGSLSWYLGRGSTHIPVFEQEINDSYDDATVVLFSSTAKAFYSRFTSSEDVDMYKFVGEKGVSVSFEFAIPDEDLSEIRRPKFAIVGKGLALAKREVPFKIPAGSGIFEFDQSKVRTNFANGMTPGSWLKVGQMVFEPRETGEYYLVAYDDFGEQGRYLIKQIGSEPIKITDLIKLIVLGTRLNLNFY